MCYQDVWQEYMGGSRIVWLVLNSCFQLEERVLDSATGRKSPMRAE
jgi:hypothetical protein